MVNASRNFSTVETTLTPGLAEQNRTSLSDSGSSSPKYILVTFYACVLIFALPTNTVLNYLLFTRKFMRIKYIFTASIAISHILFCLTVIPLVIFLQLTHDVDIRSALISCNVIVCLCVGVTSHSMLGIAIRRCLAISERFRHANFTYRGKIKNIVAIWVTCVVISAPYIASDSSKNAFDIFTTRCRRQKYTYDIKNDVNRNASINNRTYDVILYRTNGNWTFNSNITQPVRSAQHTENDGFWIYDCVLLFMNVVIPCIAALVLQSVTYFGLKRRPNQVHWIKEIMITQQHIVMATVFLVCWTPLMVANLIQRNSDVSELVYQVLQPFAVSSLAHFPLIYYFFNAHINREFNLLVRNIVQRTE